MNGCQVGVSVAKTYCPSSKPVPERTSFLKISLSASNSYFG
jgi:hypothetical protein